MNDVNRIIFEQEQYQGQGMLPDPIDERDYVAEELMGAKLDVEIPSFEEGYNVLDKLWPNMPNSNQAKRFSCVGDTFTHYKQVLQCRDTGEKTILSPKSIYNPIAIPYKGAYLRDGATRTVNYGVNKESTVPSDATEAAITAPFIFTKELEKEAAYFKNRLVASMRSRDFDVLAKMMFLNNGFGTGWGNHAQWFKEYGIISGNRYLLTHNSYGAGSDMHYFESMKDEAPLFNIWTAIDERNMANEFKEVRLVRGIGEKTIWYVLNNKRYHVKNPTMMGDGMVAGLWGGFTAVEDIHLLDLRVIPKAKVSFRDFLSQYLSK